MRVFRKILFIGLGLLLAGTAFTFLFMQRKTFGKNPSGAWLDTLRQSPNYRDGAFQNPEPTEVMLKSASTLKLLRDFLNKPAATRPPHPVPSVRTDLRAVAAGPAAVVWFGHSSYLLRVGGTTLLVDPVFSGNASPVSFFGKSFPGSDAYAAADMPPLDAILLTHDHYDHLDYATIAALAPAVKRFYTPLGVGAHLRHWGVPPGHITELEWWQAAPLPGGGTLTAAPARHFSGRGLVRNRTLWTAYALHTAQHRLFLGGDSGYGAHFAEIGGRLGPFDMALLEAGQYGSDWPYIHMTPEQTVAAARDLRAAVLMPVHWGKFALAYHAWDDPIKRVVQAATTHGLPLATPRIGEPVPLGGPYPTDAWWTLGK